MNSLVLKLRYYYNTPAPTRSGLVGPSSGSTQSYKTVVRFSLHVSELPKSPHSNIYIYIYIYVCVCVCVCVVVVDRVVH